MSTSPTPEEREKKDAEAKAREEEEQSKLPYKWTQTIGDLDITVPVPGNLKGKDFNVVLSKTKLKVGVKGQEPILEVRLRLFHRRKACYSENRPTQSRSSLSDYLSIS